MRRNLGGAICIAVCATILNDRTNLHFLRLAEHLNATNVSMEQMLHRVSTKFAAVNGGDIVHGHRDIWLQTAVRVRLRPYNYWLLPDLALESCKKWCQKVDFACDYRLNS
jgi:DHA2 family multidrug resistance protein